MKFFLLALLINLSISNQSKASDWKQLRRSVFKIYVTSQSSNFKTPWLKNKISQSYGSGFYIGNGLVMTNAHVVANATFIEIQKDGDDKAEPAYVSAIAHDSDLAVLQVQNKNYFNDSTKLEFGKFPKLRSKVTTAGYPRGGQQISLTEGIVSRIDYLEYAHDSNMKHLLVQVDSAINPGNSGGPVFQDQKVIGVAFQGLTTADNTGYIIPTAIVKRFLKDIGDNQYDGHPELGIEYLDNALKNDSLRKFYNLKPEDKGILIENIHDWSPAKGKLQKGDIITQINSQEIGVDGKIVLFNERVEFLALFDLKNKNDTVTFDVIRNGRSKQIKVHLTLPLNNFKKGRVYPLYPKYLHYGGLIFSTLTRNLLETYGNRWYDDAPFQMRYLYYHGESEALWRSKEEYVFLITYLPHQINHHSINWIGKALLEVDGKPIQNLSQLSKTLTSSSQPHTRFRFWQDDIELIMDNYKSLKINSFLEDKYKIEPKEYLDSPKIDSTIKTKRAFQ